MEVEVSINRFEKRTLDNNAKLLSLKHIKVCGEYYYFEIETLEDLDRILTDIWKVFGDVDVIIQPNPLELFIDF